MDNNILNSTYVGHIKKNLKGGLKIINDTEDKNIIQKRNFILNELSDVFKGGRELMYEDIPHYAQALEGKYIRNKMCKGGNPKCTDACNLVKKSYHKLIRKSLDEFNKPELLSIIKGGSPYLFKKLGKQLNLAGGNPNDIKVDLITNQIEHLDRQCSGPNECKKNMTELSNLRSKLNKAWMDSSYCQIANNCFVELSNKIISITPNYRSFKESLHTEDVDTQSLSPRDVIEHYSPTGGLYDHYSQYGGNINDNLLEQLRIDIKELRGGY